MIGRRFRADELYEFVHLAGFDDALREHNLTDDDLAELQETIMSDPTSAPVIPGTGGIRKMRFSPLRAKIGKRGAFRICYAVIEEASQIVLMVLYSKSKSGDLTAAEKKGFKTFYERFKKAAARKKESRQ